MTSQGPIRSRIASRDRQAAPASAPNAAAAPIAAGGGLRGRVIRRLEASGRYPTWVLFAALAGMFATTFPVTILTVSLGSIAAEFSTSETTIAWVISAPMLLSAVSLPLLGKLGDLYGHRRVFLLGFAGATVVAALTALAWSPLSLIGFRTLSAVLGGATQPTAMALIFGVYEPQRRVRAMGWWSMTTAAAPALGLIAGGPLVDLLGWRVVFIIQAALSALALGLAAGVLQETSRQRVRFDLAGAATLALGVGGLMFMLGRVRDLGIASPWIALAGVAGVIGLAGFYNVERRVRDPLLPLEFFRRRAFTAPIIANALMASAYFGAFVTAPFVLLRLFGFSITIAAGIMLIRTASLTLASPIGGYLGARIGPRRAAVLGCTTLTLGLAAMAASVYAETLAGVCLALILQGVGHGLALPSLTSSISNAVREESLGIASAANRLTAQSGSAFGITLLTLVHAGEDTPQALGAAFLAGAGLSALSVLAALRMSRSSHVEHVNPGKTVPAETRSERAVNRPG